MKKYKNYLTDLRQTYLLFLNSDLFDELELFESCNGSVNLVEIEANCLVFEIEPRKRTKELALKIAKNFHGYCVYYCNGIIYLIDHEDDELLKYGYKLASRY